ncbi:hypothetical protein [Micromonospora sp. KC721]|uniref:hypothetical protein n=1 Tax=Micromonospora sp. KC721 TaxID=2530380 RepID=UPI001050FC4B|nr:hypothetical protein [Micromonospora sp. KC721]TDB81055.1 hypothetical protein E1182_06565 [Micromonospora sp. KC721]
MSTNGEPDAPRTGPDWRSRLSVVLLSAASGMGINVLSNDVGYRGVAAATAAGAILSAAASLRRLPPRASLVRHTARTLLALALLAAIAAAVGPAAWAAYTTLTAAALTIAAVLTTNTTDTAINLLMGAAGIGLGVAFIGGGITVLVRDTGLTTQLRQRVAALTRDPAGEESTAENSGRVGTPSGT